MFLVWNIYLYRNRSNFYRSEFGWYYVRDPKIVGRNLTINILCAFRMLSGEYRLQGKGKYFNLLSNKFCWNNLSWTCYMEKIFYRSFETLLKNYKKKKIWTILWLPILPHFTSLNFHVYGTLKQKVRQISINMHGETDTKNWLLIHLNKVKTLTNFVL